MTCSYIKNEEEENDFSPLNTLTYKEKMILELLSIGLSTKCISFKTNDTMSISPYLTSIKKKLNAKSIAMTVAIYTKHKVLEGMASPLIDVS